MHHLDDTNSCGSRETGKMGVEGHSDRMQERGFVDGLDAVKRSVPWCTSAVRNGRTSYTMDEPEMNLGSLLLVMK